MARSIHKLPTVIPTGRIHAEKPRPNWRRLSVILLGLGLLILGYWFIYGSPVFTVTQVEVVGIEPSLIKTITDPLIGSNIWRVNTTAIEENSKHVYGPINTVTVVRGLPHTVRLQVALRQPKLRWQVGDTVSIIDDSGQVFSEGDAPQYATLPKVIDRTNFPVQVGQRIVAPSFVTFLTDVQTKVPDTFHRAVTSSEITVTTFHIDVILEGDIRIRLTTQRPLQEQLDGAVAILNAHPTAKIIDVRVPRWGYWQ
jgi:cell division septal protein FtsQ